MPRTPLLPSFTTDLSALDEDGIRLDVRQSVAHSFFSMMAATETGLSPKESKRMLEIAVDEAGDDIVVTTSVILDSFDENMALMEHAEKVGVRGILLGYPPTFHPSDPEEVYSVTKRFAELPKLAGYFESAPSHAGRFMKGAEAEAFARSMADRAQVVHDLASQLIGLGTDA